MSWGVGLGSCIYGDAGLGKDGVWARELGAWQDEKITEMLSGRTVGLFIEMRSPRKEVLWGRGGAGKIWF